MSRTGQISILGTMTMDAEYRPLMRNLGKTRLVLVKTCLILLKERIL